MIGAPRVKGEDPDTAWQARDVPAVMGETPDPSFAPADVGSAAGSLSESGSRRLSLGILWLQRLWLPLLLIAVWEAAVRVRVLDALFFPPPSRLFFTAIGMLRHGDLASRIQATVTRTGMGFLTGALAGIVCGTLMGTIRVLRRAFAPLIATLYTTPKLTLLPMLLLLVGTGETPRLILIAITVFLLVTIHTHEGVTHLDRHYVELAVNHGANRGMLFRRVYLPASLPHIFTGLRLAIGRGLGIAISAEMLTVADGLGGLVSRSWQTFAMDQLYVAVITTAALGACLQGVLKVAESWLLPWRKG